MLINYKQWSFHGGSKAPCDPSCLSWNSHHLVNSQIFPIVILGPIELNFSIFEDDDFIIWLRNSTILVGLGPPNLSLNHLQYHCIKFPGLFALYKHCSTYTFVRFAWPSIHLSFQFMFFQTWDWNRLKLEHLSSNGDWTYDVIAFERLQALMQGQQAQIQHR